MGRCGSSRAVIVVVARVPVPGPGMRSSLAGMVRLRVSARGSVLNYYDENGILHENEHEHGAPEWARTAGWQVMRLHAVRYRALQESVETVGIE